MFPPLLHLMIQLLLIIFLYNMVHEHLVFISLLIVPYLFLCQNFPRFCFCITHQQKYLITLYLYRTIMIIIILLLTLGSVDCSSYGNAISLVNASQYHFIPNGSFLQFSLSSAELGYDTSQSFTKISGRINITLMSIRENDTFNFIVFPPFLSESEELYQCYMRSAFEGIQYVDCYFNHQQNSTDGDCSTCVQKAIFNNVVTACLNCSQNFSFKIYSDENNFPKGPLVKPNGTILMIIDNTNAIQGFQSHGYLELQMGYNVEMSLSESGQNFLSTFTIIVGVAILILIGVSLYVKSKIRAYEKKIKQKKQ